MRALVLVIVVACGGGKSADNKPAEPAPEGPMKMTFRADGELPPREGNVEVRGVDLPVVTGAGFADVEATTTIAITKSGIVVEGKTIVAIDHGMVDPAEKEGGALGINIPRLQHFMQQLAEAERSKGNSLGRVNIAADKTTPYAILIEVISSTKRSGQRDYAIVAKAGDKLVGVPITVPEKAPPGNLPATLGMIVSVTDKQVLVWSVSGLEGTLQRPKKAIAVSPTAAREVADTLADIAKVRAPQGEDRRIILQADQRIPLQTIAEVLGAMRPSFPEIQLSSGFE